MYIVFMILYKRNKEGHFSVPITMIGTGFGRWPEYRSNLIQFIHSRWGTLQQNIIVFLHGKHIIKENITIVISEIPVRSKLLICQRWVLHELMIMRYQYSQLINNRKIK